MQDIPIVIKDKKSLKNLMRPETKRGVRAVSAQPRLVESARKHQTITDTQRVQERNVTRGGKVRLWRGQLRGSLLTRGIKCCRLSSRKLKLRSTRSTTLTTATPVMMRETLRRLSTQSCLKTNLWSTRQGLKRAL